MSGGKPNKSGRKDKQDFCLSKAAKSQSYFSNVRAITSFWISLVPSPMVHSLASR